MTQFRRICAEVLISSLQATAPGRTSACGAVVPLIVACASASSAWPAAAGAEEKGGWGCGGTQVFFFETVCFVWFAVWKKRFGLVRKGKISGRLWVADVSGKREVVVHVDGMKSKSSCTMFTRIDVFWVPKRRRFSYYVELKLQLDWYCWWKKSCTSWGW